MVCYKSHLQILKNNPTSTDDDLSTIILNLKSLTDNANIECLNDVIDHAMQQTCIYVGEALLNDEAMLLPSVHTFFHQQVQEISGVYNINTTNTELESSVTPRWILSNLTNALKHHLKTICKIKKHGTILYRKDGDMLGALSKALHKNKLLTNSTNESVNPSKESTQSCTKATAESINHHFRLQIAKYHRK